METARFHPVQGRFGVSVSETGLVWYVAEIVTRSGLFITHSEAYRSRLDAEKAALAWAQREEAR